MTTPLSMRKGDCGDRPFERIALTSAQQRMIVTGITVIQQVAPPTFHASVGATVPKSLMLKPLPHRNPSSPLDQRRRLRGAQEPGSACGAPAGPESDRRHQGMGRRFARRLIPSIIEAINGGRAAQREQGKR